MKWNKITDKLPPVSGLYHDDSNYDEPKDYPVLVFSPQDSGIQCVACLIQEQDEKKWNFEDLSWELYIPGDESDIIYRDLEDFTHWIELPKNPNQINEGPETI